MRIRVLILLALLPASALADFRQFQQVSSDPAIAARVRHAAEASLAQFPKLTADNLAISVVDVTRPELPARGDYHGDTNFYPASVIKLFFMTDTYARVPMTPEVERALKEMIVVSDNDATAFLVDILAGTCSGPDLTGRALRRFIEDRRGINKRFAAMGYDISAMMKPWSFGPFGRELQLLGGKDRVNRNRLTANATAALMLWIVRGRAAGAQASMKLLERPLEPPREDENQVKEFIGEALPAGSRLWSKAGWTSEVRHDAAYVELPGGRKLIVVIFTRGTATDVTLVPAITKNLLAELGR